MKLVNYKRLVIPFGAGLAGAAIIYAIGAQKSYVLAGSLVTGSGGALIVLRKKDDAKTRLRAAPLYQFAKNMDKSEPQQLWFRGMEKAESGDTKGAIKDFQKALAIDPNHRYALNSYGKAEFELGNYDAAILFHTKAIDLDPGLGLPHLYRGNARKQKGDLQGAYQDWRIASKLGDPDAELLIDQYCNDFLTASDFFDRAIQKHQEGNYQGSIQEYLKAIELDSTIPETHFNIGLNRMLLGGDQSSAIEDFTAAIEINPGYFNAYNMRGLAKMELGQLEDAIVDFDKAIEINMKYLNAFSNRATARFKLEDYLGSIFDYSMAIGIDPQNADLYFNRANAKMKIDDLKGACADWKNAKELGDEDAQDLLDKYC